jgi:prevent-host-death family protein
MTQVNIHEAKTHLSRLLVRVLAGEEIVISKAGKPMARLVPYQKPARKRVLGRGAGQMAVAEDFDAPLPKEILTEIYS